MNASNGSVIESILACVDALDGAIGYDGGVGVRRTPGAGEDDPDTHVAEVWCADVCPIHVGDLECKAEGVTADGALWELLLTLVRRLARQVEAHNECLARARALLGGRGEVARG